jgi:hypothetical protein
LQQPTLCCPELRALLQIQLERRKALMLQQQLEQLNSKLGTTRNAMGSIFSAKEKTQALQKQIKILENRLEKQYIKYNEVGMRLWSACCDACLLVRHPAGCNEAPSRQLTKASVHDPNTPGCGWSRHPRVQLPCLIDLCRPSHTTSSCASR